MKSFRFAAFPAHWAPNDLKIYKGTQFPQSYRGGAFIAFHGSWNRSSGPQAGYNVVFQPIADGKASGKYTIFADGFAGKDGTSSAQHRPTGLAVTKANLINSDRYFGHRPQYACRATKPY